MIGKRTLAVAVLLLAAGWLGSVAAQTQQNQANRARPATQGGIDDIRADLAAISRELTAVMRTVEANAAQLRDVRTALDELRQRASEQRDRIADSGVRIAETQARVGEIAARMGELRAAAATAYVAVGLGATSGQLSQAVRDAAAATCEAMAASGMTGEVVYAQSGASIGSSQVVCRLVPR